MYNPSVKTQPPMYVPDNGTVRGWSTPAHHLYTLRNKSR